ncbi:phosphatidylinositol 4-kinase gamma 4 [Quercus suber]|uniref:1-phosphatidylinositol 4-kinase n=1 Tax=Quercus suber TaxID=58331 RepID=A0AAW0K3H1_QUESU|nr:phosphatidylinositol 4-kinase gamma 4-like isoform X1 [Quercus suber]XP_023878026.1 phosphatidylinositol 4-kinase gamma 4-like isoform X2 [Quercus suber]POE78901.1 phosphatidylinositol 4-kinase gamma 4 [Quercus suber]
MSAAGVALSPIRKESVNSAGHYRSGEGSILVYLTVAGSVIPMRVLESDSISSVKLRIQTRKGFVVKKQKLVYGGRELARNDTLIKDYGVTGGDVLHLVLKLSDLLLITVRTYCGKEFEFQVDRYRNVGYIKQRIWKKEKGLADLEDKELFCNGKRLEDQVLVDDICNNDDAVIHLVVQKSAKVRAKPVEKDLELLVVAATENERRDGRVQGEKQPGELQVVKREPPVRDFCLEPITINPKAKLPSFMWDMIKSTFDGLERGNQPIRSSEGTGGAYFMQDSLGLEYVSVFKPIDEEPMAVYNPTGLPVSANGEGLKRGTKVGEGALREVAAYILDHPRSGPRIQSGEALGFAGVPPTALVRCLHKGFYHPEGYDCTSKNVKIGSLQLFMKNDGSCEDIGPGSFPVDEVHKISVLDIRMANADRHAGNILFRKREDGQTVLIPIDHGYCLPEIFEDCTFDWLYWPQARQPYSPDTVDYINSLDAEQDIALLKFYGWDIPLECARTLRVSTMLLKKGVERGLTPFAIGSIMCRENLTKESVIEEIVREAKDSLLPGMSEAALLEAVSQIMDSQLDKLA